ncbi:hypothetical protein Bca4012_094523 [Brassica carinata]|uniref:(rape) hypothetical protein n=1 Tax=Brassica napus TaxID=3708 RepID=A0A816UM03_BRANA|nr:uncharacterized protein LOC106425950 [Brassica napus]KAH0864337.1 hypothetical protein HID58_081548 [Brassica napus]CAF2109968.1 unnamed protein product [Brassica napus]
MAMGKNKKPIYESRAAYMDRANGAGFKAKALILCGTTPFSRGLNSLRHQPLAQVSKTQPISRNGDGITPLLYGYPAALTRNNALSTSTFETSPPSPPSLEEESMKAPVAAFENRMTQDDSNMEDFSAWSPFDEPFITIDEEQQPENVPPQVPVSSSYDILDCPNALNDSAQFPRTLLSDNLNWPNFSHCLRSEQTPLPQPTTSPSESLIRTGSAHGLRSGNIPATRSLYPNAYGPVPATLPSWNPYWPSYPNGQGSDTTSSGVFALRESI